MANVMALKELRNHPSKNGFSLDKRVLFTANAGELDPIYVREVIPGDSFDIDVKSFTRTAPMQTAAMTRLREHVEFFFVPTNLLWNKFNQFITQATENNQNAYNINGSALLSDEHPYITLNQLLTHYNRQSGNDIMGMDRKHMMRKLLMYLGYGDMKQYADLQTAETAFTNCKLNPFPFLAYQKVYSDHFRDSQWETADASSFNINYMSGSEGTNNIPLSDADMKWGGFELRYANWHKDLFMGILPRTQFGSSASVDLSSLYQVRQSPVISIINNNTLEDGTNVDISTSTNSYLASGDSTQWRFPSSSVANIAYSMGYTPEKLQSVFTVLALRQAESKQKWAEISQSVQQDYQSQMKAHFDVNLASYYSDRSIRIGGTTSTIDINEVVNQNLSTTAMPAIIKGKGVGVNSGQIKFSSDVHGYIIGIYHVSPMLDYALRTSVPRIMQKTNVMDYAIPEFDRIGMQALPLLDFTNREDITTLDSSILGYVPRYYDYKTDYDTVVGGFLDGGLGDWVCPVTEEYLRQILNIDLNRRAAVDYRWFKINPKLLNAIFATNATNGFYSDHFRVNMSMEIRAQRKLDRDGLPY